MDLCSFDLCLIDEMSFYLLLSYNFDLRRAITRSTGYLQAGYLVELKDTKTYDPFTVTPPQSGGRVIDFLAEPFAM